MVLLLPNLLSSCLSSTSDKYMDYNISLFELFRIYFTEIVIRFFFPLIKYFVPSKIFTYIKFIQIWKSFPR